MRSSRYKYVVILVYLWGCGWAHMWMWLGSYVDVVGYICGCGWVHMWMWLGTYVDVVGYICYVVHSIAKTNKIQFKMWCGTSDMWMTSYKSKWLYKTVIYPITVPIVDLNLLHRIGTFYANSNFNLLCYITHCEILLWRCWWQAGIVNHIRTTTQSITQKIIKFLNYFCFWCKRWNFKQLLFWNWFVVLQIIQKLTQVFNWHIV